MNERGREREREREVNESLMVSIALKFRAELGAPVNWFAASAVASESAMSNGRQADGRQTDKQRTDLTLWTVCISEDTHTPTRRQTTEQPFNLLPFGLIHLSSE